MSNRILVVAPESLEQLLWCQGLLRQLRAQAPHAEIDLLAAGHFQALVTLMPEVTNFIARPVPAGQWRLEVRWQLAQHIRQRGYQQAFVCPDDLPSALVPWLAGIPLRTGWLGSMRYFLLNDPRRFDSRRMALHQRYTALAADAGTVSPADPLPQLQLVGEACEALLQERGLQPEKLVALCPLAGSRDWPEERVTETALLLLEAGWQVIYLGGAEDAEVLASELDESLAAHFCDLSGRHLDNCHRSHTDMLWTQALLLSACEVACGDDPDSMLLAASVGTACLPCSDTTAEQLSFFGADDKATAAPDGLTGSSDCDDGWVDRRAFHTLTPSQLADHVQRVWG